MLKIPVVYLKDKQAFEKKSGSLRLLGNAVEIARGLSKKYKLLHIVDLDLKNGSITNFDIYNKLTYFINIQVECDDESAAKRLLGINARIVLQLPTNLPLEKWGAHEKLLVGIVRSNENADKVHDVIIANPTEEKIEKYNKEGKRILVYESEWGKTKSVWGIILL